MPYEQKKPEKIRVIIEVDGKDRIVFPIIDCGVLLPPVSDLPPFDNGHASVSVHDFDEQGDQVFSPDKRLVASNSVRRFVKISILGELVQRENGVQYYIENVQEESQFFKEESSRAPSPSGDAETD